MQKIENTLIKLLILILYNTKSYKNKEKHLQKVGVLFFFYSCSTPFISFGLERVSDPVFVTKTTSSFLAPPKPGI
ncbi:Uncharacterised protein [Mesomycoplasma hyorhinis]|nr:Uncharacterised protein [Mesomycoplasma hyorhinis]